MTELERYKEAVRVAKWGLLELATLGGTTSIGNTQARDALGKIEAVLNPPPAHEEVTVERWECKTCGTMFKSQDVNGGNACCWGMDTLIPLTGTRRVQVAQKVQRSVSVEARIDGTGDAIGLDCIDPFREHPEVWNKKGVLSFTAAE